MVNLREPVFKKLSGMFLKHSVQHIFWAMFTQGMLSVVSFLISFILAVKTEKKEYGMYVLLFSIIGIFGNYHNAIVNTPLTILIRKQKNEKSFVGSFSLGQWFVIIPLVMIMVVIATVWSLSHNEFTQLKIAMVLSIGIITFAWREFIRTLSYSLLKVKLVLKMDIIFTVVIFAVLGVLMVWGTVSSCNAIIMLGVGYFISAVFGNFEVGNNGIPDRQALKDAAIQSWKCSRWSLIGVTSGLLQHRGYLYVITWALGLSIVGDTSAARLLMMPIGFLIQSSGRISLAKAAEILANSGVKKVKQFSIALALSLLGCCILYTIILYFFYEPILALLGSKYQNISGYVWFWALYFAANCIRYPLSNSLLALSQFKSIAIYDIISGFSTIIACIVLTNRFAGHGAIAAVAGGEIVLCILTLKLLMKFERN